MFLHANSQLWGVEDVNMIVMKKLWNMELFQNNFQNNFFFLTNLEKVFIVTEVVRPRIFFSRKSRKEEKKETISMVCTVSTREYAV